MRKSKGDQLTPNPEKEIELNRLVGAGFIEPVYRESNPLIWACAAKIKVKFYLI